MFGRDPARLYVLPELIANAGTFRASFPIYPYVRERQADIAEITDLFNQAV